jgi:hypothetical protein
VLYPNVAGFGSQRFLAIKDPELQLVCVRAYNDFLRDWASADPRRLITVMVHLHLGSGDTATSFSPDRIAAHGTAATYAYTSTGLFLKNGLQVADLLTSGVLPRFPALRVVSVESGIGDVLGRLEVPLARPARAPLQVAVVDGFAHVPVGQRGPPVRRRAAGPAARSGALTRRAPQAGVRPGAGR